MLFKSSTKLALRTRTHPFYNYFNQNYFEKKNKKINSVKVKQLSGNGNNSLKHDDDDEEVEKEK